MTLKSTLALPALLAAALAALPSLAGAQAWPNRSIRMIVPLAAGGGTDIVARMVIQKLAERTGAKIYLGAESGAHFTHIPVRDGDTITFGRARMEFRQTPGHTLSCVSIVLTDLDAPAQPKCVFTGDTLFIGDVGRPDLSPSHTPQQLADFGRAERAKWGQLIRTAGIKAE